MWSRILPNKSLSCNDFIDRLYSIYPDPACILFGWRNNAITGFNGEAGAIACIGSYCPIHAIVSK